MTVRADTPASAVLALGAAVMPQLEKVLAAATAAVRGRVTSSGRIEAAALDREQRAVHGLAWLATYVTAIRELVGWGERLLEEDRLGAVEADLLAIGLGEYCAQIVGGIPMSQGEIVRGSDMGIGAEVAALAADRALHGLAEHGNTAARRASLVRAMVQRAGEATVGDSGLDETLDLFRAEMRRFATERVVPHAQNWHRDNAYIPLDLIAELAEMGVFGLTIPEAYGGLGLGKVAMCVVTEELSRGYIGVGSLGTRSEIAAELILAGGTEAQKAHWLPGIASGAVLTTAVFTEPDTGSDLGALRTRAVREGDVYRVHGNKTWITHPVRADLMMLLVRTDPAEAGWRGLSMLLAEKPRGDDREPFPAPGMSGGEIAVLGYRGMKEFEIAFDGFEVPAENLLGGVAGEGFKHLMQTFESARIQTAARAVGVAQNALDLALAYAGARLQFGQPLVAFPRISDKLAMMAAEVMIARQLTYAAARAKEGGRRCDLEAGMAKLLGARVAWAAADNALQVHGGNGFALDFPVSRVLCDARILNIFEGAAEIQAQVVGRRLLESRSAES